MGKDSQKADQGQPWFWLERHCPKWQNQADPLLRRRHQVGQDLAYRMEGSRFILWVLLKPLIQLMPAFGQGRHLIILSLQIKGCNEGKAAAASLADD